MSKVKILLVGSIGEHVDEFLRKLAGLQKSKAGPFDACFCVGISSRSIIGVAMPIPVYLQDCSKLIGEGSPDPDLPEGIRKLNTNLYALQGSADAHVANIWSLQVGNTEIVVASVPPHTRLDSDASKFIQEKLSHVSYVGCDLCLTSEFPQGIESLLPPNHGQLGSFDVADIALRARARYHIAPSVFFAQSSPFKHLSSSTSTFAPKHIGRFISLASVASPQDVKDKGRLGKYVHALGMTPLHHMVAAELQQIPEDLRPCPYTDESYQIQPEGGQALKPNSGLSEAHARRLMAQNSGQDYRWSNKRKEMASADEQAVDESNTTLFLHGLHKEVSGHLQNETAAILRAFEKFGSLNVRRPPAASSYAFLEFDTHASARNCLQVTGGEVQIAGIHLTLKWGSHTARSGQQTKKSRLTEAEAIDSSTIHFRLPHKVLSDEIAIVCENIRKIMEETLENALGDPDVTAATEPALQVKLRIPDTTKGYGFLDFASHAAASMALASRTGSIDGGLFVSGNEDGAKTSELLIGTAMHWAPSKKKREESVMIETASGVRFERQHFPADSRTDCWFCLASPTCEKHLITSVHNQCYITMTKGPVHKDGHVLIVPVTHTSQGALSDPSIASEIDELKAKLRRHASDVWDMDLFVFERAIQTKGGYHTHVQCVPVPKHIGNKLESGMVGMARASGFILRELNSDIGLTGMAEDGYFYAEISSNGESKRFLYRAGDGATVPLQFGREVLASVLDRPDLAHWKACVLTEADETSFATKFRESFSKYDS